MTLKINKPEINIREEISKISNKVTFGEVVRGLGEYTGNVGIGTAGPGVKLDVNDNTVTDNAWNTLARFRPDLADQPAEASIHIQSYPSTTTPNDRKAGIQSVDDAGNARSLIFNKDGGNVGIGTTIPGAKLHVDGVGKFGVPTGGSTLFSWSQGQTTNVNQPVIALVTNETNNQDRVRFNSDGDSWFNGGNVGIGTTDPGGKLEIEKDSYGTLSAGQGNLILDTKGVAREEGKGPFINFRVPTSSTASEDMANIGAVCSDSTASSRKADLVFWTRDTSFNEKMRIDSSGNVGIGTTNPGTNKLDVQGALSVGSTATSTSAGYIKLQGYRNASDQGILGHVRFDNQNEGNTVGKIEVYAGGSTTTGTMRFHTSGSEMRIAANGNAGIGTTDPANFKLNVQSDVNTVSIKGYRATTTANSYLITLNSNIAGSDVVKFRVEADGDVISATNSYTSDERAKTEISDLNYGIDTINQLQPKQFKMLHSEEKGFKYGFVAQEIETVLPDLVREDGIEDGEGGSYKALEYNSIIGVLTKAIQEQQQIIEDLKSRIETLESK